MNFASSTDNCTHCQAPILWDDDNEIWWAKDPEEGAFAAMTCPDAPTGSPAYGCHTPE